MERASKSADGRKAASPPPTELTGGVVVTGEVWKLRTGAAASLAFPSLLLLALALGVQNYGCALEGFC